MKYNTTSSLFHYTNCLEVLGRILSEGLLPNYCKESYAYNGKTEYVGIPMVSFCDIPVMRANGFCDRYGKYAIGLSKEWGIKNGINPVFYAANEGVIAGLWFYRNYQKVLESKLKKAGSDGKSITIPLKEGQVPELVNYLNSVNAKAATTIFYGLIKRYESEHNGNMQLNYIESEWRYVISDDDSKVEWLWGEDKYKGWRGSSASKPEALDSLKEKRLRFEMCDIKYIIVENEADIDWMIEWLGNMTILGGKQSMNDDGRKRLLSKLISMEQIEKDF